MESQELSGKLDLENMAAFIRSHEEISELVERLAARLALLDEALRELSAAAEAWLNTRDEFGGWKPVVDAALRVLEVVDPDAWRGAGAVRWERGHATWTPAEGWIRHSDRDKCRARVIIETLRFLSDWLGDGDTATLLGDAARQVEVGVHREVCPLCQSMLCEAGCPIAGLRSGEGR
jgi:hypothetical protein